MRIGKIKRLRRSSIGISCRPHRHNLRKLHVGPLRAGIYAAAVLDPENEFLRVAEGSYSSGT
jgi:hypothetical protein